MLKLTKESQLALVDKYVSNYQSLFSTGLEHMYAERDLNRTRSANRIEYFATFLETLMHLLKKRSHQILSQGYWEDTFALVEDGSLEVYPDISNTKQVIVFLKDAVVKLKAAIRRLNTYQEAISMELLRQTVDEWSEQDGESGWGRN